MDFTTPNISRDANGCDHVIVDASSFIENIATRLMKNHRMMEAWACVQQIMQL